MSINYPTENIKAITEFLFIEQDITELEKANIVLVLCNDNIGGIAQKIHELFCAHLIDQTTTIIISGATGSLNKDKEKESVRVKERLTSEYGYPSSLFILDEHATNIYENLYNCKKIIGNFNAGDRLIIIGAAFALRRIKLCASALDYPLDNMQYIGTVDVHTKNIGKDCWWQNEEAKLRVYQELERIGKYLIKGDLDIK